MNKLITIFVLLFIVQFANAQFSNMSIIQGSTDDAKRITIAYLSPLNNSVAMLNHQSPVYYKNDNKPFNFYFGVSFQSVYIPSDNRVFDITKIGLEEYQPADPNNTIAQTIFGGEESILLETKSTYRIIDGLGFKEVPLFTVNTPQGYDSRIMPYGNITVGAAFFGNYISFNVMPKMTFSDSEVDMYSVGINLRHEITDIIDVLSDSKWNFSFSWGFQLTEMNTYFDIQPDENIIGINLGTDLGPYDNQRLNDKIETFPLSFLLGYSFGDLNVYGGPSIAFTTADVHLFGNYPVYTTGFNMFTVNVRDIEDPFEYTQQINQWKLDLGVNYQFKNLVLGCNLSLAEYSKLALNIGMTL